MNLANIQRTAADLVSRSEYLAAKRVLDYCVPKIPGDSLLRYLAFKVAAATGGGRGARLQELLALNQKDEVTLFRQFSALMSVGEHLRAYAKGEELISVWKHMSAGEMLNPAGDDLWFTLGKRGVSAWASSALKKMDRAPSALKKTPWHIFYKAVYLDWSDKKKALRLMSGLAEKDARRYGWMLYYAGRLQVHFGRLTEAVSSFDAALKCKPDDWMILCAKAECLACLGNYRGAHAVFKTALRRSPGAGDSIGAWRGEILLWQGKYAAAVKVLDEALASCPPFAYSWRGIASHKLGNRAAALDDLKKALAYNPRDLEALVYRAEIARLEKDQALAERLLRDALSENPLYFWALANSALIALARGRHKEGLDTFNLALSRLGPLLPGRTKAEASADEAARTLRRWFRLSKGNRRDELHCLASWLAPGTLYA